MPYKLKNWLIFTPACVGSVRGGLVTAPSEGVHFYLIFDLLSQGRVTSAVPNHIQRELKVNHIC